ncbi:lipopolysaccharide export system protein LptC [Paracoccus isoporae]|uniref:Lipopolysaccharide export system protein LptC n=1 Tax=Paracoccus isoporae TaxID=591205 RepID=A0A1G6UKF8_9RHOB|nr:hypothetical protein [Paracoccus isoporae]SDD41057.1 lipopolysaccharide export system protein LptC [Paracoccus isoporae]
MRSRVIAWLRVLLPLAALAILSTLFLLGRSPDPDDAIPYADVDAEELARDPRMTRPEFAGVTNGGAAVTLTADRATPNSDREGSAETLRMTWRSADGLAADLTAPHGDVDGQAIRLDGGVRVTTSDGWAITVPQVESDLDADLVTGTGGLTAFAPMGRIDAAEMVISRDADGAQLLNLSGDVRLLYEP